MSALMPPNPNPAEPPSGIIRIDADLTQQEYAKFARRFREAQRRPLRLIPPLRRRTRLRLAATRRIDKACCWLVDHHGYGLAVAIWRACWLWRG